MRKKATTLTTIFLLLFTFCAFPSPALAAPENPFTASGYSFHVWDDLSGRPDKEIALPAQNSSNADVYYYSGNYQTKLAYLNEELRINAASDWQSFLLTTGKTTIPYTTRNAEGYGCYIRNTTGSGFVFSPLLVGNDYYIMRAASTAYLITASGSATQVTSLSFTGGIEIPAGFEGFVAVPFSSMYPTWGYASAFVPGQATINYFSANIHANFSSNGSAYIALDRMFLYGRGVLPQKEYLIKGGSSVVSLGNYQKSPFADSAMEYYIWDDLSGMPNMNIPLPTSGENAYVRALYGAGTHSYAYQGEELRVTGAAGWKMIQLKTGHSATAAQTAGTQGVGFYIRNKSGKSLAMEPLFRGSTQYRLKASAPVMFVDMDGFAFEEAGADWGGIISVPGYFEGYLIVPHSSLKTDSGQAFVPGTHDFDGFTINLYVDFPQDGNRYIAYDNMFLYGKNLSTVTPNAVAKLLPDAEAPQPNPGTQPVAAPMDAGYNGNKLVGVDQFGRTFSSLNGLNDGKQVGMFFWLWNGQPTSQDIYDMTEFMKTPQGAAELFSTTSQLAPTNQAFFWGEPLFGYYNSLDEYVMRKQIEMLTLAGVDFLTFDTTNAVTYPTVYKKLFKLLDEYQKEGWDVPKISFYTHSQSIATTRRLYLDVYKANLYPNLWYYYKGKPMIISYTTLTDDLREGAGRDDAGYLPGEMATEILDFFSFKYPQWPNEGINHAEGVPYVEWEYPQPVHNDLMNVSVASQHWACMSNAYTHPTSTQVWGRGFDFNTNKNVAAYSDMGAFYQSQWNQVFKQDPDITFIDGWNEWIGYKIDVSGQIVFVDAFTKEFSRDIEPMKGGHEDAFYLQTIKNIRQYKGETGKNYLPAAKTVNIAGSVSQWDTGAQVYRAFGTTGYGRDSYDAAGKNRYTQSAPRNNLQEIRVTNDSNYIYFYILSENNITSPSGTNWMNLFIGTGAPASKGWNGYEYVLNRQVNLATGKTDVMALSSNFGGTKVAEADVRVDGRIMQIRIARSALSLSSGTAAGAQIYFKLADGVQNPQSIENYYISGKSLPMGRVSFSYDGVTPTALAAAQNPMTDPAVGLQVYEDFSTRGNMNLPLANQNEYFWQAPNSANYKMAFVNNRLMFTKAKANEETEFMLHLSSGTSKNEEALRGMQGVGFYVENNTENRVLLSPMYVGTNAFYLGSGKTAKLIHKGGGMELLSDSGQFTGRASFAIPSGFKGYITFKASDFICSWTGSTTAFTAGNFALGYFSMRLNIVAGCNEATGTNVLFDNMFFYGEGMTPYGQHLVRPTPTPQEDPSYGVDFLSTLGSNFGAWIVDAQNGNQVNYSYKFDGLKLTFTGGSGYNMLSFNLFPSGTPYNCAPGSNVEGIGFYVENNTGKPLSFQPVIPSDSYSILRSHSDYYLVTLSKKLTRHKSTPTSWGGGNVTVPTGFKGYVLTSIKTYGNWWGSPDINQTLTKFGVRGSLDLNGGTFSLADVFVYGRGLTGNNMGVDVLTPAQETPNAIESLTPTYSYTDAQRVQPVWTGNTMRNECVTLVEKNGVISGKLLFNPEKIISIRNNSLNVEYKRGIDWRYDGATNSIVRLPGSSMPYFTLAQLAGEGVAGYPNWDSLGRTRIGNALYCVTEYLYSRQLSITYTFDENTFALPHTPFSAAKLPKTLAKLSQGQALKVTVYGDSIMAGCDASGMYNRAPYMPLLHDLVKNELQRVYGSSISMNMAAVGGYTSAQGLAEKTRMTSNGSYIPDLVILSFGQNDSEISPAQTIQNMQAMIQYIKGLNPNAEFIILSTIAGNSDAGFAHNQAAQAQLLKSLEGTGTAYIDINSLHSYLGVRKNYIDLTGNNINHPNDFMIRMYAMQILGTLVDYGA